MLVFVAALGAARLPPFDIVAAEADLRIRRRQLEKLRTLRERDRNMIVIMVTGSLIFSRESFDAGSEDYMEKNEILTSANAVLTKPFDIQKLLDTLKNLL